MGGQVSNATTLIDDFYGKVRAFVAMTVSSLPDLPNTCECGSQDFILTELLYERNSSVVSCEDDGTLTGYTDGHSDYLDTTPCRLFTVRNAIPPTTEIASMRLFGHRERV